jgi:UDP-N-acetylmuramoylalanine--D-glutamate ligase
MTKFQRYKPVLPGFDAELLLSAEEIIISPWLDPKLPESSCDCQRHSRGEIQIPRRAT